MKRQLNSMELFILLATLTISYSLKLNIQGRQKRDGAGSLKLDALISGSQKSNADLHEIYDKLYAQIFSDNQDNTVAGEPDSTTTPLNIIASHGQAPAAENSGNDDASFSNASGSANAPHITSVVFNGTTTNNANDTKTGLRINNGMVSGEMYRVMQNATYIEASSGGNDTASAALQSDLLLTDGTNGGQNLTIRGSVAAAGSLTLVRSIAGTGDNAGNNGVSGIQVAAASGPSKSSSSSLLIIGTQ